MSQSGPSHSPGGSTRVPVYLTGAPRLSRLSQDTTRSPRVSASNRHSLTAGSAFDAFDAPAYCNEMAAFIAEQLSLKAQKGKLRDQAGGRVVEDRWRGPASQREEAKLADASVQTTTLQDDAEEKVENEAGMDIDTKSDDIDPSRTRQKLEAAEAFLQQLKDQSEEVTEAEKGLEEQVLSIFGADTTDQSSEKDESESSNDVQPELAAHIAGMLAEKEKVKNSGLLIEEVNGSDVSHSEDDDDESSNEDEEEEEDTSEEESQDDGGDVVMATHGLGAILPNENQSHSEEEEEEEEEEENLEGGFDSEEGGSDEELHYDENNETQLYADDMRAQSSFPLNETIELLDSEEEEEIADGDEEEIGDDVLQDLDQELMNDEMDEQLEREQPEQINSFSNLPLQSEEAPNLNLFEQATSIAIANAWDSINESDTNEISNAHEDPESQGILQGESGANTYTESNLFEQPASSFVEFMEATNPPPNVTLSDNQTPYASPLPAETSLVSNNLPFATTESTSSLSTSEQEFQEAHPPPVSQYLLRTSSGADLLSMKAVLGQGDVDTSRAVSVSVQPGTPQRAQSAEHSRDTEDGTARHARDLFHIKSVAQKALNGSTSLATSMASDLHSVPHHSDVDFLDQVQEEQEEEHGLGPESKNLLDAGAAESGSYEEQDGDEIRDFEKVVDKEGEKIGTKEQIEPEKEMVGIVEHEESDAETEQLSFSQEIEVQSFKEGSTLPDHIFGQKEESEGDSQHTLLRIEERLEPFLGVFDETEDASVEAEEGSTSIGKDDAEQEQEVEEEEEEEEVKEEEPMSKADGDIFAVEGEAEVQGDLTIKTEVSLGQVTSHEASPQAEVDNIHIQRSTSHEPHSEVEIVNYVEKTSEEDVPAIVEEDAAALNAQDGESEFGNMVEEIRVEQNKNSAQAKPKKTKRVKAATSTEPTSPLITRQSLRRSASRAASEVILEDEKMAAEEEALEDTSATTTATPSKRGKRSRASTRESPSPLITKGSLRKTAARSMSEAASEDSPRKRKHQRHKSDASGDLADYVPDEVELVEEDEIERPIKRSKSVAEEENINVEAKVDDEDEEMLDTSILEEDESQMDIDGVGVDKVTPAPEKAEKEQTPRSRRRSAPHKSNDASFRLRKAEESESEEDEDAKARKLKREEQQKKRKEEERERRKEQREAKRLEKESQQQEEKEVEKAAAGLKRKARSSQDVKAFRPVDIDEVEEEEEDSKNVTIDEEDTIAKRRSKRRVSRAPL